MHIDWFVFFAQIVNFLILVFLLKYLLYGRIIKAMDNRQTKLASQFDEAQRLRKEAEDAAIAYDKKNQSLENMVEDMLNKAREAAEQTRRELEAQARQEVDLVQQRWYETLNLEKKSFLENLRRRSGAYVYDAVRRILIDLADGGLEQRIVTVFMERIRQADEGQVSLLRESAAIETGIVIRSSFELSPAQRTLLEEVLAPYTADGIPITYEVSPVLVAGIEMMVHGHKFSWSINDYIDSLQERFSHMLKEEIPSLPGT